MIIDIAGEPLSPGELCGIRLQNKIGLAPLNTGLLNNKDYGQIAREFYLQFAENNVGLIIIGGIAVSDQGRANSSSYSLWRGNDTSLLHDIIASCHSHGASVSIQLEHAGRQTNPLEIGYEILAASAIPCPVVGVQPREVNDEDIGRIVSDFAFAASKAEEIGTDFIEIHAAHGYFISGFLSLYSNKRSDRYGQTIENRFFLLDQVLSRVRNVVSIPIGVRFSVFEGVDKGLSVEDIIAGVRTMTQPPDYISVSAGVYTKGTDLIMPPKDLGKALWRKQSRRIRSELGIPVLLAGNIDSINTAASVINSEDADIALMGRALLSDPFLITKHLAGKDIETKPCIYCELCKYHSRGRPHIYCPLNKLLRSL